MGTVTDVDRLVRAAGWAVLAASTTMVAGLSALAAGTGAMVVAEAFVAPGTMHVDLEPPDGRVMAIGLAASFAGALLAPVPSLLLVDRTRLEAYVRLLAVVGFALLAAAGTALSPVPGAADSWPVAGLLAAGVGGAALMGRRDEARDAAS